MNLPGMKPLVGKAIHLLVHGGAAVCAFFILSGVVNRLSIERRTQTSLQMLHSRSLRLLPIYLVVVAVCTGLEYLLSGEIPWRQLFGHLTFTANLQGDVVKPFSVDPALWSMSYEACFYLLLAVYLAGPPRIMRWCWLGLGATALLVSPGYHDGGYLMLVIKFLSYSLVWFAGFLLPELRGAFRFNAVCVAALLGAIPALSNLPLSLDMPWGFIATAALCFPLFIYVREPDRTGATARNKSDSGRGLRQVVFGYVYTTTGLIAVLTGLWWTGTPVARAIPVVLCIPGLVLLCPVMIWLNRVAGRFPLAMEYAGRLTYAVYLTHMPVIHLVGLLGDPTQGRWYPLGPWRSPVALMLLALTGTAAISVILESAVHPAIVRLVRRERRSLG